MKACVVVPTYNERENVGPLVEAVKAAGIQGLMLLFVDDSSPDGTADAIRRISESESWVHLLVRSSKKGLGSAYQDGFRWALDSLSPEIVVEMDADLQHPPAVLPAMVQAVAGGADVAVASRYVPGGGTSGWGLGRRVVSKAANSIARTLLRLQPRDCTSGFRAYSKLAARRVVDAALPAKGFEFQVAALHALKGARIVEVPFTFVPRKAGKSKLGLLDMVRFFVRVVRIAL